MARQHTPNKINIMHNVSATDNLYTNTVLHRIPYFLAYKLGCLHLSKYFLPGFKMREAFTQDRAFNFKRPSNTQ